MTRLPLHALSSFEVVLPRVLHESSSADAHHTRLLHEDGERALLSPHGHALHVADALFRVQLPSREAPVDLQLRLNTELFSPRFVVTRNGEVVQRGAENCYYTGSVRGREGVSFVAVDTCGRGVDGMFFVDGEKYVIEPAEHHGLLDAESAADQLHEDEDQHRVLPAHIVYRMSDVLPESGFSKGSCGLAGEHDAADDESLESFLENMEELLVGDEDEAGGEQRRSHSHSHSHGHGPASRKLLQTGKFYNELLIVNDKKQVEVKGGVGQASKYAISIANAVNGMYSLLKRADILVLLVAVENWETNGAQISVGSGKPDSSTDISNYLSAFSSWASTNNKNDLAHDNAQLLTGWGLSGGVAGVAWVSAMCGSSSSGLNEDSSGSKLWTIETMTHEMGHNFGAHHDSDNNACADRGFIMAAVGVVKFNNASELTWSACSEEYIGDYLQTLQGTTRNCFSNQPTGIVGSEDKPVCGDYIISGDEQCDYALTPTLCTTSCNFKAGVTCTTGECCTGTGQFKAAGTKCRDSQHECDVTDYCSGSHADCPADLYKPDGTDCSGAGPDSKCYGGTCLGYDGQCDDAFSQYSATATYSKGNCTVECGDLICMSSEDKICYTSQITVGGQVQTVQVLENTPCAPNKICQGGVCSDAPAAQTCGTGCGEHGTCTSGDVCSCDPGWAGDKCDEVQSCDVDCDALFRNQCVASVATACGDCVPGRRAPLGEENVLNSKCSYYVPHQDYSLDSLGDLTGTDRANLFDQDSGTVWRADVRATRETYVLLSYAERAPVRVYEIQSGEGAVTEDPSDWILQGSNDGASGPWRDADTRSNVQFSARSQVKSFVVRRPGNWTHYRLNVVNVRGGYDVGKLQISELRLFDNGQALPPGWEEGNYGTGASDSPSNAWAIAGGAAAGLVLVVVGLVVCVHRRGGSIFGDAKSRAAKSQTTKSKASSMYAIGGSAATTSTPAIWSPEAVTIQAHQEPAAVPVYGSSNPFSEPDVPEIYMEQNPEQVGETGGEGELPPLPFGWTQYYDDAGNPYFYNSNTGESVWERPI